MRSHKSDESFTARREQLVRPNVLGSAKCGRAVRAPIHSKFATATEWQNDVHQSLEVQQKFEQIGGFLRGQVVEQSLGHEAGALDGGGADLLARQRNHVAGRDA